MSLTPHEQAVAEQLEREGWKLQRSGWPDWIAYKMDEQGRVVAVRKIEAKADNAKVSDNQRLTFELLRYLGIRVEIIQDREFYRRRDGDQPLPYWRRPIIPSPS